MDKKVEGSSDPTSLRAMLAESKQICERMSTNADVPDIITALKRLRNQIAVARQESNPEPYQSMRQEQIRILEKKLHGMVVRLRYQLARNLKDSK